MTDDAFEPSVAPGSGGAVRYRMYGWWNALLVYVTVVFACVGIVVGVSAISSSSAPGIAFFAAWIGIVAFALHFYTWGVASAVALVGETLTWSAPRRTTTVDIADVVAIGRYEFDATGVIAVLGLADGRKLPVMVRKGFADLAAALAQRRPGITISLGPYSRACERLQRRSGFSRETAP